MIRLSRLTDYAVVIVAQMATDLKRRHTVPSLSEETGVPEPTVSKIMKKLSKTDMVISYRGVQGGYALTKPASEISMNELITTMDGPILIVDCVGGRKSKDCAAQKKCPIRGNWDEVNNALVNALESIKLSDMGGTSVRFEDGCCCAASKNSCCCG